MNTREFQISSISEESVGTRKKSLRAYMKKRRADNENRDVKETLLIENFFALLSRIFPETDGAGMRRNVFIYLSFSSEAPTDLLIETLQENGYKVYCPKVEGNEMVAVEYGEDFTISPMRIREPIGQAFDGEIDCIVTPLLAVDKKGTRLGYGGGYYDRFFEKHKEAKRIGYAFDFQVLDSVPSEEWDVKLEYTVTDKRVIEHKTNEQ